jgi:pyruvate kinase
MIEHARPTRAEVTDVAMACLSNVDAVMLSAETASGRFPLEAVRAMDSVLRETETYEFFANQGRFKERTGFRRDELLNALGVATAQMSRDLKVRCISVLTRSGRTARIVSADRPAAPMLALTHFPRVARRLNLLWGVYPRLVGKDLSFREFVGYSQTVMKELGLAKKGDCIIMLSGLNAPGNQVTNSVTVHRIT